MTGLKPSRLRSRAMITAEGLFEKLRNVKVNGALCTYTLEKCASLVPLINAINEIKKTRNAVILAHSYVAPEIVYGVADFTGDSYGLSKDAVNTTAERIVFSAVRFMGETAKILNPEKEVLIPGLNSGCTLADAVTGADVRKLRAQFPSHTFVCYINTTADVKAECDVCVTSSNVYNIVEAIPNDKIYFLPDKLMGKNLQDEMARRGVYKDIQLFEGTCYVHEQYDPEMIQYLRIKFPKLEVITHPECSPAVVRASDFIGSTSQMLTHVAKSKEATFLVLTECGLVSRLQTEHPDKTFVGSCTMCRYMKSNTLEDILRVLINPRPEDRVELDESIRLRALKCIEEMFRYTESVIPKHAK
jgi:quinolinate synthase